MNGFLPIIKRELLAYFRSPVAYVFIIIFLVSTREKKEDLINSHYNLNSIKDITH